jgi:hypothetical protein
MTFVIKKKKFLECQYKCIFFVATDGLTVIIIFRCCVGQILQVIESLGGRTNLRPLKLRLLYDLWVVEDR